MRVGGEDLSSHLCWYLSIWISLWYKGDKKNIPVPELWKHGCRRFHTIPGRYPIPPECWQLVGLGDHSHNVHLPAVAACSACPVGPELCWCPLQSKQLSWDSSVFMGTLVLPGRENGLLGPEEEGRLFLGHPATEYCSLCPELNRAAGMLWRCPYSTAEVW